MIATHPLSEALQYIRGVTFDPDELVSGDVPGAIACMRTKNVQKELDESDLIYVPKSVVKRDEQMLRAGDLLISSANSWELVGKTVRVNELAYLATAGGFISILRPNHGVVDPNYLYRFIAWDNTQHAIRHMGRQTTNISNLDRERFLTLPIPLPPLATQQHIAHVLEQADQLRKQAQQMESELNQLAQSLFLEMFGDPIKNPKGWNRKPLSDVAKLARGRFSARPRNDPQFYGGQYPFIQTGTVVASDTYITTHEQTLNDKGLAVSKIFPSGTIAITIAANIGATAILAYPTCFPDSVVGITAGSELGVEFLEYQLRFFKLQLDADATETAQKNINLQVLEPLMMIVPPRKEQEKFMGAYKLIHEQLTLIRNTKLEADNGFNALMQRAFNGELTERKAA